MSAHVPSQEHLGPKGLEATQPHMQLLKEFSEGRVSQDLEEISHKSL